MKKKTQKILAILFCLLLITALFAPFFALADELTAAASDAVGVSAPSEPFTWQYLATISGAAAFTLLVVQFFKVPLDKLWKIPTRVFAYFISLAAMLVATAFTSGLDAQTVLLAAANAFISAMLSYGAYELTFAKLNK